MENIPAPEKKGSKSLTSVILLVLLFLIIFGIFGYILLPFKDYFGSVVGKGNKKIVSSPTQAAVESPFSKFVGGDDSGVKQDLDSNMKNAFDFLFANQTDDESIKPVIIDGQIVIQVENRNGEKYFKLLASKDSSFKHSVGDEVSFNPVILPQNLLVQVADRAVSYSFEIPNFKIPDSLKIGDKIVFICRNENCKGNELDWGFVYTD